MYYAILCEDVEDSLALRKKARPAHLDRIQQLVDQGNTVIIIEHNLEVIKSADWILDLGPEGGNGGGEIIATGTPEDVAASKQSFTGEFLKPLLKPAGRKQRRA